MLFCAGLEDMMPEPDAMIEDDSSKHVSSTFRGVYKRKFDTKWRAEITAGATFFADYSLLLSKVNDAYRAKTMVAAFCCMHLSTGQAQIDAFGPMSKPVVCHATHRLLSLQPSMFCVHNHTGRRKRCLGSFASEREAAEAYDKAALTLR